MSSLTGEQEQAIARRAEPVLLAAGAGSGKTSVLVERFVRAVREDRVAPARILAITFTERAAGELRERVRERLLALGEREAARDAEAAFVSTFHGFCARLLRGHPLLAGLDPEYRILDEGVAARLRERAFSAALRGFLGGERTEAVDLMAAYGADRVRSMVEGVYAELRSRGERRPRLPLPAPERGAGCIQGERQLTMPVAASGPPADSLEEAGARACALLGELLEGFGRSYDALKRERAAVDFDDLELCAGELLAAREDVRAAWAERFELLMVDEFQDTNPRQLAILTALDRGNLFTVGDELQSIYAFRHADVNLFRARRAMLAGHGASLQLTANFRSRAAILEVVNAVFGPRFGEAYTPLVSAPATRSDVEQAATPSTRSDGDQAGNGSHLQGEADDVGPLVELLLTGRRGWEERGIPRVALPRTPDWRAAEARMLAGRIAELVQGDQARAGDVVVLLRAVGDLEVYERALQERGLPTLAAVGGFWAQQQVGDLLAYLRTVANLLDEPALLGTLASPLVGCSSDGLALLARAAGAARGGLWETVCRLAAVGPGQGPREDPLDGGDMRDQEDVRGDARPRGDARARGDARVRGHLRARGDEGAWDEDDAVADEDEWDEEGEWDEEDHAEGDEERDEDDEWEPNEDDGLEPNEDDESERDVDDLLAQLSARDRQALVEFHGRLRAERVAAPRRTLSQLIERSLAASGYREHVLGLDWGERRLANIYKLLRLARHFEASEGRDLRGFLDYVAHQQSAPGGEPDAPVAGGEPDAVRLMSIHAAKGLEFPVVCVADLGRAQNTSVADLLVDPGGAAGHDRERHPRIGLRLVRLDGAEPAPTLDFERLCKERRRAQAEEEERILYVAMTRARERLLLSGAADFDRWPEPRVGAPMISWLGPALAPELPEMVRSPERPVFDLAVGASGQTRIRCWLNVPGTTTLDDATIEGRGSGDGRWEKFSDPRRSAPSALPAQGDPGAALRAGLGENGGLGQIDTLSYTALGELERCGYRYYLERILGLREDRAATAGGSSERDNGTPGRGNGAPDRFSGDGVDARTRGTLVHGLLESLDFAGSAAPSPEDVARAARELGLRVPRADRMRIADLVGVASGAPPASGGASASPAARVRDAVSVSREQPFAFSLGSAKPLLIGVIDVVARERDGGVLIVDYKTDRVATEDDLEALVEREYGVQRLVYALAALSDGAQKVEVVHWFLHRPDDWAWARFEAGKRGELQERLSLRIERARTRGFSVSENPHRGLCETCPGRAGLCSYTDAETLREAPRS
jgi:ATP-dependent exoDNAse (exonuclease V) beta subunit